MVDRADPVKLRVGPPGSSAPERSRTSLNSTAPSPIASARRAQLRDRFAPAPPGRARAGPAQRRRTLSTARRPARGEHLAPAGIEHGQHRPSRSAPACAAAPQRERLERRDADQRDLARPRQRPRRGDPDPQAGERARADPDRDPVDSSQPTPPRSSTSAISASSRVACLGRSPGGGSSRASSSSRRIVGAQQRDGGRARRGVERRGSSRDRTVPASIRTCAGRRRRARSRTRRRSRPRPASRPPPPRGHSTNAIVSGPR